ncbi:BCLA3 protein, partial [Atractosteus spatula]|nr:BCLA3 protein [Atractosteus spatula]
RPSSLYRRSPGHGEGRGDLSEYPKDGFAEFKQHQGRRDQWANPRGRGFGQMGAGASYRGHRRHYGDGPPVMGIRQAEPDAGGRPVALKRSRSPGPQRGSPACQWRSPLREYPDHRGRSPLREYPDHRGRSPLRQYPDHRHHSPLRQYPDHRGRSPLRQYPDHRGHSQFHAPNINKRPESQNEYQRFAGERRVPSPRHFHGHSDGRRSPPLEAVSRSGPSGPTWDVDQCQPIPPAVHRRWHYQDSAPGVVRSHSPRHDRKRPRVRSSDRSPQADKWMERMHPGHFGSQDRKLSVSPQRDPQEFHGRSSYAERCREELRYKERRLPADIEAQRSEKRERRRSLDRPPSAAEASGGQAHGGRGGNDGSRRSRQELCEAEDDMWRKKEYGHQYPQDVPGERRHKPRNYENRDKGTFGAPPNRQSPLARGRMQQDGGTPHLKPTRPARPVHGTNGDVDLRLPVADHPRGKLPPGEHSAARREVPEDRGRRQGEGEFSRSPPGNLRNRPNETLTIKVDMSHSMAQSRLSSYSSDRQLSLDLVHVRRPYPDLPPVKSNGGSSGQRPVGSGDFAQEIITLVHQVKESYCKDKGITLNDRFSSILGSGSQDEEWPNESLRFDRRIDLSLSELKVQKINRDIRNLQPTSRQIIDPNDLRHDLERRRQERRLGSDERRFPAGSFPERQTFPARRDSDFRRENAEERHFPRSDLAGNSMHGHTGPTMNIRWKKPGFVRVGLSIQNKYRRLQAVRQRRANL